MKSSPRIYLGTLEDKHIERFIELSADPELVRTMGWKPFHTGEIDRFLGSVKRLSLPYLEESTVVVFTIITLIFEKVIGYTVLKGINRENAWAEIGMAIAEKEYRSHGYGTEALHLTLNYAFTTLNLNTIYLTVFPENTRAVRLYEKLAFRKTGLIKKAWFMPDGTYSDLVKMELTKDGFHRTGTNTPV